MPAPLSHRAAGRGNNLDAAASTSGPLPEVLELSIAVVSRLACLTVEESCVPRLSTSQEGKPSCMYLPRYKIISLWIVFVTILSLAPAMFFQILRER
jgi:hypothetical protein